MALSYICQKAETIVVLVVCFSQRPELRWLPHMDIGRLPLTGPYMDRSGTHKNLQWNDKYTGAEALLHQIVSFF
jgi:hypothetical protein